MNGNRIRKTNKIQMRRLWIIFAICSALTVFGLIFVFLQVRIVRLADDVRKMEASLEKVQERNQALKLQVDQRQTPRALQMLIQQYNIGLVSTSQLSLVDAQSTWAYNPNTAIARKDVNKQ